MIDLEPFTTNDEKEISYKPFGVSGLGGWLILVQIGLYLTIIGLLIQIVRYNIPSLIDESWQVLMSKDSALYDPFWQPLIIFNAFANISFFLFSITVLVLFYRKKSMVPRLMIILYSASLLIGIVDYILLLQIGIGKELDDGESIRNIIKSSITCLIWIPYFLISERVQGTFVN